MNIAGSNNEIKTFLTTFITAFLIIVIVATPIMTHLGETLDSLPFGDPELPTLENMEFEFLIPESSPFFDAFTEAKKVNILVLGVNQNLTDTIMLVCLDTKNRHVDLIWIPRDTYYYREGYYSEAERKINAAYRKNPINSAKAVSDVLLGIPINYYVVLDYEGVERIVDTMGGVPMDIPFNMRYSDPYDKPPLHINIPKGEQILDGKTAVQFLRYRRGYVEGDLGRIKAQQQFMLSAFKQCISFDLPKIAKTVFDNVTSDVSLRAVLYLAGKGVGLSSEDIRTFTMPGWADPDPPYYVHPRAKDIAEMLAEVYSIERVEEQEEADETEERS